MSIGLVGHVIVEDDPHMKGDYTSTERYVTGLAVEDDPHMKGDYTS